MPIPGNTITLRHDVEPDMLADIMNIASLQSIDGWADVVTYTQAEDPAMTKMEIIETADDPPRHHTITGATIILGMQRIIDLELPPPVRGSQVVTLNRIRAWIIVSIKDGDATMIDAHCADAIIQYGLFNKLVY